LFIYKVLLETLWVNGLSAQKHPLLRGDKLVKNTTCRGFLTGKGCVLWGAKSYSGTHPSFDEPCYALSSSHFPSREGIQFTSNRLLTKFPVESLIIATETRRSTEYLFDLMFLWL